MIDTESAFYQKATGMNITDATRLFQRCVLQKGKLDFEGNPDLGGIGVRWHPHTHSNTHINIGAQNTANLKLRPRSSFHSQSHASLVPLAICR